MVFSNVDEEIEKLKKFNEMSKNFNAMEVDKMYISKEQLAEIFQCSSRAAGEFMNSPGFPLIKIGGKSFVNVFALDDYTRTRRVISESKR